LTGDVPEWGRMSPERERVREGSKGMSRVYDQSSISQTAVIFRHSC
jgi:hypothetical protein